MAFTSKYFVLTPAGDNLDFLDFDLRYGSITTVGESIQFNGSAAVDSVFVRPGLTYDLSSTAGGIDKIYLTGNLSDYQLAADSTNSTLTLSRTVGGLAEAVIVSRGTSNVFDKLVFANGTVSTVELYDATSPGGVLPKLSLAETSLAPIGAAALNAHLDATIKAFSSNPAAAGQVGETFASVRPGINYIVNGGNAIDTVYVADGSQVDATVLGQSVDLVYMRGKWSDYTKTTQTDGTVLVFTRQVNGVTESVKVDAGTSKNYDRLVFADGSVTTYNATIAIATNPNVGIAEVTGYNANQTTPLYSEPEVAAALATIRDAAENNSATSTTPAQLVYKIAGVTDVTQDNLAAINSALNSTLVDGAHADTALEVQAIVNAYNAILASADSNGGNTTTPLTAAQYTTIGVTDVSSDGAGSVTHLLDDVVDASARDAIDSIGEIQSLANAAKHVLDAASGSAAQLAALTVGDMQALGVTGLTVNNFADFLIAIAGKTDDAVDTRAELQALVGVDHTPPTLQSSTPSDGGSLDARGNLTLTFSENVFLGSSGTITLKALDGATDIFIDLAHPNSQLSISGKTLTINPSSDFAYSKQYAVEISSGAIVDAAGNNYAGINDTTTLNFATQAAPITRSLIQVQGNLNLPYSAAGDFNGDGFNDVMVTTTTNVNAPNDVEVLFGSSNGLSGTPAGTGGLVIHGIDPSFGYNLTSLGDVNGDGFDDLGIATFYNYQSGTTYSPPAYVIYGKADGSGINMTDIANGVGGFKVPTDVGTSIRAYTGTGDVNGDGYNDYAVGNYGSSDHVGFGGPTGSARTGFDIVGNFTGTSWVMGDLVNALGDVNGDGLADIAVNDSYGAYAYIVYGKKDTSKAAVSFGPSSSKGFYLYESADDLSYVYSATGVGDINGDGYSDILAITGTGACVVFGSASGVNLDVLTPGTAGFRINYSATTGYSNALLPDPAVGDFNGDGLTDFMIGTDTGNLYIVFGKTGNADINLDDLHNSRSGGIEITGGGQHGQGYHSLGDVNGDGLSDIGRFTSQGIEIVYGSATGATGPSQVDQFGTSGDDLLVSSGNQSLVGGQGKDTLVASGADILSGGAGNDIFVIGSSTATALQAAMGTGGNTTQLSTINGGSGIDTIQLSGGASMNLDLLAKPGLNMLGINSRVESIEKFDLSTDTAANTLTLNLTDLFDMSDAVASSSTLASLGWSGGSYSFAAGESRQVMVIDGSSNDKVVTTGGFSDTHQTAILNGHTYEVYNQGNAAQLLIDMNINRSAVL